jgi:uncharacterized SAM-binding protein YcdF (DUF218 family)
VLIRAIRGLKIAEWRPCGVTDVHLLEPYTFVMLCLIAATIWAWRRQRPRTRPLIVSTVLICSLIILSLPVTGFLAMRSLEASYPPNDKVPARGDTLLVLSAGLVLEDPTGEHARLDHGSTERCLHAVRLYKRAGGCRMILSGGKGDWSVPGTTLAETMRDFVVALGVRPDDIVLENKSTTTYENATNSRALLNEDPDERIWLVTEASHMNRAERCFRKLGITVTPAPCDHQATYWKFSLGAFIPSEGGLAQITRATHEWLGRIWYRLRGRI